MVPINSVYIRRISKNSQDWAYTVGWGLRSFMDSTGRLKTRADDNHVAPDEKINSII